MNSGRVLAALGVWLWLCIGVATALYLDLRPGDMRCVGQELDQLETVVFSLSASSLDRDPKQKVTVKITDPADSELFYEKIPITGKRKELEHVAEERGVYELCFELFEGKQPVRVFLHVDYKPLDAAGHDLSRKVNQEDVPKLELDLRQVETKISEILIEIEHAKAQEASLNEAQDLTTSRLQWFSSLSICILLGTSVWQIVYLRNFFASKKLL